MFSERAAASDTIGAVFSSRPFFFILKFLFGLFFSFLFLWLYCYCYCYLVGCEMLMDDNDAVLARRPANRWPSSERRLPGFLLFFLVYRVLFFLSFCFFLLLSFAWQRANVPAHFSASFTWFLLGLD